MDDYVDDIWKPMHGSDNDLGALLKYTPTLRVYATPPRRVQGNTKGKVVFEARGNGTRKCPLFEQKMAHMRYVYSYQ